MTAPTKRAAKQAMSAEELRQLPAAIDLVTAANALNIGRTRAYQLVKADAFPVPVLRIGWEYRVRLADVLDLLGVQAA